MMKLPAISYLIPALALAGAAGTARLEARTEAPATETSATQTSAANPKGLLNKGMSADEVVNLVGKPMGVTPLKVDGVKAEKWIYRQLVSQKVTQEATDVTNEPAFVGNGGPGNNTLGGRVALLYSLKHVAIYQTTALLMINDELYLAKQWNEEQVSYDH